MTKLITAIIVNLIFWGPAFAEQVAIKCVDVKADERQRKYILDVQNQTVFEILEDDKQDQQDVQIWDDTLIVFQDLEIIELSPGNPLATFLITTFLDRLSGKLVRSVVTAVHKNPPEGNIQTYLCNVDGAKF